MRFRLVGFSRKGTSEEFSSNEEKRRKGLKEEEVAAIGAQLAMAPRPSPFKSRCSAILKFKNGPCILSARNTHTHTLPSGGSFRGLFYLHPRSRAIV